MKQNMAPQTSAYGLPVLQLYYLQSCSEFPCRHKQTTANTVNTANSKLTQLSPPLLTSAYSLCSMASISCSLSPGSVRWMKTYLRSSSSPTS
jgi:hypothetical protein